MTDLKVKSQQSKFKKIVEIHTVQKHTQNGPSMLRSRDNELFVFWPFLVFGLDAI